MDALIVRDDNNHQITFTAEALRLKTEALEASALIGKVTNADEQQQAVSAQMNLKRIFSLCEKAEEECKKPLNDFRVIIIQAGKTFRRDLLEELTRVSALVGDFQALEGAPVRASETTRLKNMAALEIRRQAAIATAKDLTELDIINETFNRIAETLESVKQAVRAEGQIVRDEWEVKVVDIYTLARVHPNCVKIEPRLLEIKELLNQGVQVHGVEAQKITKSTVRLAPARNAITV